MEKLVKEKLIEEKKRPDSQSGNPKRSTDNLMGFIVILYFIVTICVTAIFQILDLSIFQLFRLFILTVGISFLIPIKVYRKRWALNFYEYLIYNIVFVGPTLLLIAFSINFINPSPTYTESYAITAKERIDGAIVLGLENNKYQDKTYLRTFSENEDTHKAAYANRLELEFSNGLLGIRIIKNRILE